MAFGLTALGTGLGGLLSGYQQQQQNMLKLDALRAGLQQEKLKSAAQSLIGQALSAGGLPGFGNSPGGGLNLPGGAGPVPPPPGQSSQPAAPPPPAMGNPYAPMLQPAQQPAPQPQAEAPVQPESPLGQEIGAAPASGETPLDTPSSGAVGAAAGGATNAGGVLAPSDAAGGSQPVNTDGRLMFTDASGRQMDLSGFIQHVDPQAIAARIKQVRPDADPAAIGMATQEIYKLAMQGDKMQQLGIAATLKYLGLNLSIGSHEKIAAEHEAGATQRNVNTVGGAMSRTLEQQAGANQRNVNTVVSRESVAAANREATAARSKSIQDRIDERLRQTLQTRQMSMQQKAQAQAAANGYKNIMTQLAAVKAEFGIAGPEKPADKARVQALQDQAVKLYGQLVSMGIAVDTPRTLLPGEATIQPAK